MGADASESTRGSILVRVKDPTDQKSWAEFVRIYGPAIRRWLLHWRLQPADVEDVTQDVLVRLIKVLPRFEYDRSRSFRGLLKTLTHHAWHDFMTHAGNRQRGSGDSAVHNQLHSVAARDDLTARLEAAYDVELLDQAMGEVKARVAPATWEAFRLTALDHVAPQEVADRLGLQVAQVYLARHRVQKLLQKQIKNSDGEATDGD